MNGLISFLICLILLVTLSGLGAAASAMTGDGAVAGCCSGKKEAGDYPDNAQTNAIKGKTDPEPPCNDPGCPCSLCLPDYLAARQNPGRLPTFFRQAPGFVPGFDLSEYIPSIEYPPEFI